MDYQFKNGFVFLCNHNTEKECFGRKLFGGHNNSWRFIKHIDPHTALFLLRFQEPRILHGIFKAAASPGKNIEQNAWNGAFPAQVRVKQIAKLSTTEAKFCKAKYSGFLSKEKVSQIINAMCSSKKDAVLEKIVQIVQNYIRRKSLHEYIPYNVLLKKAAFLLADVKALGFSRLLDYLKEKREFAVTFHPDARIKLTASKLVKQEIHGSAAIHFDKAQLKQQLSDSIVDIIQCHLRRNPLSDYMPYNILLNDANALMAAVKSLGFSRLLDYLKDNFLFTVSFHPDARIFLKQLGVPAEKGNVYKRKKRKREQYRTLEKRKIQALCRKSKLESVPQKSSSTEHLKFIRAPRTDPYVLDQNLPKSLPETSAKLRISTKKEDALKF